MLNRVVMMGRLTHDPELRYTPQNTPVCTITIACDRDYVRAGEQRETDFIDVVCWNKKAEFVAKWFRKGQLTAVEGRLQSRKYTDKNGQTRVIFEIICENAFFAESKAKSADVAPDATAEVFDKIESGNYDDDVPF